MKQCTKCKQIKNDSKFYRKLTTKNVLRSYCRKCFSKIAKENRNELSYKLKINGCAICGYNKCLRALHFHHVNLKDKKFEVNVNNINKLNFINEIIKCVLLCANCHAEIEDKEKEIKTEKK